MHLHSADADVDRWLSKKSNKYTSHEFQDTILKEMAHKILREIGQNIRGGGLFSIIADECTDYSNKEQFAINFRWVDSKLQDYIEFIGLYSVDSIDAKSLIASIKDVLLWMGLPLSNCRGQCYDEASNMSRAKGRVAPQLTAIES